MTDLTQKTVLIVEDDVLISLDLTQIAEGAGCRVMGPYTSAAKAYEALNDSSPDMALVDFDLGDHTSADLLGTLLDRAVPVTILSGHPREELPAPLRGLDIMQKPVVQRDLERRLADDEAE